MYIITISFLCTILQFEVYHDIDMNLTPYIKITFWFVLCMQ